MDDQVLNVRILKWSNMKYTSLKTYPSGLFSELSNISGGGGGNSWLNSSPSFIGVGGGGGSGELICLNTDGGGLCCCGLGCLFSDIGGLCLGLGWRCRLSFNFSLLMSKLDDDGLWWWDDKGDTFFVCDVGCVKLAE